MVDELMARVSSFASLWSAARRAARGKRNRASVAHTLFHLESTVIRLERELREGSWRPGPVLQREIFDPKRRLITVAPFEDRIVHQSLCAAIGPLLDRHLVAHTYACRVGLGTHAALRQARLWARSFAYALHLDVSRFFPSVDNDILLQQITHDVPSAAVVELCARILDAGAAEKSAGRLHFPGDELFSPLGRRVGLPIGNLTSQHFANRYLSPVDHRAKDRLRVHAYLRYMDDMLLFSNDRSQLEDWGHGIEQACWRQRLRLHPWQVVPTRQGITWLGFRILPNELRVKRSSVARAERRLEALRAQELETAGTDNAEASHDRLTTSLRSTFAHWNHADSWRLRTQTLRRLGLLAFDDDDEDEPKQSQCPTE